MAGVSREALSPTISSGSLRWDLFVGVSQSTPSPHPSPPLSAPLPTPPDPSPPLSTPLHPSAPLPTNLSTPPSPTSRSPPQIPAWCTLPHFVTEVEGGPPDANISLDVSHTKGIVIGRSEERSDLAVADGSVSRQHAALVHDEEISYMVDLGSTHGTYVNASRIEEGVYTKLANGDRVSFGTCSFDFTVRITAQRLRGDDPKAKKKQKA